MRRVRGLIEIPPNVRSEIEAREAQRRARESAERSDQAAAVLDQVALDPAETVDAMASGLRRLAGELRQLELLPVEEAHDGVDESPVRLPSV